jgi:predicted DNA-binding protein (UPF0251 family)
MPRPKKIRWVDHRPDARFFKPQGIPLRLLEQVPLAIDELEALRLADFEGMSQEKAAQKMRISRATFGRILAAAHHKTAEALVHGKAIRIMEEE